MSRRDDHKQTTLFAGSDTVEERLPEEYRSRVSALNSVIARLRDEDLNQGHCFLIFDDDLPEDEALYEYPDGRICIERVDKHNIEIPRTLIKVLTKTESAAVRKKYAFAG